MPTVITPVAPTLATAVAASSRAAAAFSADADPGAELDRQVEAYVELGFPTLLGLTADGLRDAVEPLRAGLDGAPLTGATLEDDHVPFVLVLHPDGYDLNDAVPAMRRGTQRGVSVIDRDEARTFATIAGVEIPAGVAYLLRGVDVGGEFRSVRPEDALVTLRSRGRSPLTIAEGLALVTVRPDMLRPNRCFSLMASRAANARVPAVWISERRPKLGWCWDRNPHTWLGAASAADRRGSSLRTTRP